MITNLRFIFVLIFVFLTSLSCDRLTNGNWTHVLPKNTQIVIFPASGQLLKDVLREDYIPVLDDLSPSGIPKLINISNRTQSEIRIKAISIFPHNADSWHPVWISESNESFLIQTAEIFSKPFTERSYRFRGSTIHRFFIENTIYYSVYLNPVSLISESSLAIEESIRSYIGETERLRITDGENKAGSIFVHTNALDRWVSMEAAVRYRPRFENLFQGTKSGTFSTTIMNQTRDFGTWKLHLEGSVELDYSDQSPLTRSISSFNSNTLADRYISTDAAFFASFQNKLTIKDVVGFDSQNELDVWFAQNQSELVDFLKTLSPAYAFAAFSFAGIHSVGDEVYLRLIDDVQSVNAFFRKLHNEGLITRDDNVYHIQSKVMASVLGSNLMRDELFYVGLSGNAIYFSPRTTLIRRSISDRNRRRVLYFDDTYTSMRRDLPDQMSGFVYINSPELQKYLSSKLNPSSNLATLMNQFEVAMLAINTDHDEGKMVIQINTFQLKQSALPYAERWVFPLDGTTITGYPVLANIVGSARNEVLIATEGGNVFAFATDGTQIFRADTGTDVPVGSPHVYDWYANNQMTILIAAGNKIYGWNNRGIPLPNFPLVMEEQITAPIQIGDVTRNGLPELIVTTADRKIHVLDRRGQNITGWPQNVNATIRTQPQFTTINGNRSIIAFAENSIFSWDPTGDIYNPFPVFLDAPVKGELMIHSDHIFAGGADGRIYTIGNTGFFPDVPGVVSLTDTLSEIQIRVIQVSNVPVAVSKIIRSYTTRNEEGFATTERMILSLSANGTISLHNLRGELRFTETMGQAADDLFNPIPYDLNGNNRAEIIALGSFGRLFAWDPLTRERFSAIPAASLRFPIFTDLFGDGRTELIGFTREGLRCWSINPG